MKFFQRIFALTMALLLATTAPAMAGPFEEAMVIVKDAGRLATDAGTAERLFREVTRANRAHTHAFYNLGMLLARRGDRDGAQGAYVSALEADVSYLPAQARLAELALGGPQHGEALDTLRKIIEINRYQAEARNILTGIAIADSRFEDAIKHARNVLLGDPENMQAYLNLAISYYRQDLIDQAWLITKSALDRRDSAAALHNMMGLIHLAKDDSQRASDSFLRALDADPSLVDPRLNLAALELAYGDYASALRRFDEVLAVQPGAPMVIISRAVALRGMGRYDEAAAGYEEALDLRPGMPEAQYNLCVLHQQYTSRFDEALTLCRGYMAQLDRKHPKRREMVRRIKSIEVTLEALKADESDTEDTTGVPEN
jgi:tetratricopeptide (TPR) repeat protein